MSAHLVASYPTPADLVAAWDAELAVGGLLVRGARIEGASAGAPCVVEIRLDGLQVAELEGAVAAVARIGVAVTFEQVPEALAAVVDRLRRGEPPFPDDAPPAEAPAAEAPEPVPEQPAHLPIAERLAQLSVGQKISLAMSGDREARLALLRDHNKVLHAYVLRNPRIGLDEVVFAAKLTTISPDALKVIGEHKEWGANPTIVPALVRNPKSPLPVALRLLPRLSSQDLRAVAKGGARDQLVQAARKLLAGGR